MKIAFDVIGTIEGPKQGLVLSVLRMFQKAGHEIFVWSSVYSYAVKAIDEHRLKATPLTKYSSYDAKEKEDGMMDIAFEDDRGQDYLGAHKIIFVDELRDKIEFLKELCAPSAPCASCAIEKTNGMNYCGICCRYIGDVK